MPFSLAEDAREQPWGPGPGPAPVPAAPSFRSSVPGSGLVCGACDSLCDPWGLSGTFQCRVEVVRGTQRSAPALGRPRLEDPKGFPEDALLSAPLPLASAKPELQP